MKLLLLSALAACVYSHGHMTLPASTRHGGSLKMGGDCTNGACYWFTNNMEIEGKPTLPNKFRSVQLNVTGQPQDVYATSPWRAPGTAKVFGNGCGVAGGSGDYFMNGGTAPKGTQQGMDGLELPAMTPTQWNRGSTQQVAWAISANHGGGYQYRLCKNEPGKVTEECFQKTPLKFKGNTSWIIYPNGDQKAFNMTKVTEGVHPAGSEWARDPIPGCYSCQAYESCGAPMAPYPGKGMKAKAWDKQVNCYAFCDGAGSSKAMGYCDETLELQFPAPLPNLTGFGKYVWEWSILDLVEIPDDLEPGSYLLGWRWDCEESTQIWQNCADITIV